MAMSQKELKEAFVSNLTGTSLEELVLGSFLTPLLALSRGLLLIVYHQVKGSLPLPLSPTSHLLLDFSVIVLPLVLSCTVLSDVLPAVVLSITAASTSVLFYIHGKKQSVKTFLQSNVQFKQVPFVTIFRVMVNVQTAISILAVDFRVFPRRYAKTETYGTGVMDFGVGAYVLANGLVCLEARGKDFSESRTKYVLKQLRSVSPLMFLGVLRLVFVKMADYQEHVTEYGVHWNFFFTLSLVKVLASALLTVFPVKKSWLFAILIVLLYQLALETTGLKDFILRDGDREKDFLHANREGIFSLLGYVAIYLAGVQIGLYVMRPRSQVRDWLKALFNLFVATLVTFASLCACQRLVEPVSRRMANFPFCLWTVAQSLVFLSCIGAADMILLFSKRTSGCHLVPTSWNAPNSISDKKRDEMERICLYRAISRNQLFFFFLANILTASTNCVVDTLNSSDSYALWILLAYMFTNCSAVYVFQLFGITVKFW